MTTPSGLGDKPAPAIPSGAEWLNSGRDLTMDDLKGRLVLLHFWTYA